jgi:hypothetical protein
MNAQQQRYALDLAERVLATFTVTFVGQLIASGWFTVGGVIDMSILQKAGIAGLAAVLSLLKGFAAKFIGSPNTAAWLPKVDDTPRAA